MKSKKLHRIALDLAYWIGGSILCSLCFVSMYMRNHQELRFLEAAEQSKWWLAGTWALVALAVIMFRPSLDRD